MRLHNHLKPNSKDVYAERGSALVPVLFVLLIITILGLMAMRQGLVNLNISTNSQVKQLLVESADAPLNQYSTLDVSVSSNVDITTVLGSALDASGAGREFVFCYRSTSTQPLGLLYNANVIQPNTSATAGSNTSTVIDSSGGGFCDPTADFSSGRKAVVTQVAVLQPTYESTTAAGSFLDRDTGIGGGSVTAAAATKGRVRVMSTSFIPGMATGSISTSNASTNCLQGRINDNSDPQYAGLETVTDCLVRNGVPTNTQAQEYGRSSGMTETTPLN